MWIDGQDYSFLSYLLSSVISTVLWLILLTVIILLTFIVRTTTQKGRRWKTSILVGGLPVLVIASFIPVILVIIILTKVDFSNRGLQDFIFLIGSLFVIASWFEYPTLFAAILATLGVYWKLRSSMDYWTDKILPPQTEEKTSVHTWL